MSPGVIKGSYTFQCDIWSLGVVFYMMITGTLPFRGQTREEVFGKIKKGKYAPAENATPECQDLLSKMLIVNHEDRWTAQQCLKHPWLKIVESSADASKPISPEIIENLKKYRGQSSLRKAAMNMLIKMIQPKEMEALRQEFHKIDKDNSGFIELNELKEAIKKAAFEISDEEIDKIIANLDYDDNKKINYSEFLSATIQADKYLTREKILALFKQFDYDNDDHIDAQNIKAAFTKLGRELSDEEVDQILKEHDVDGDQRISIQEFKDMLLDKVQ